jgi:hypothetical protein
MLLSRTSIAALLFLALIGATALPLFGTDPADAEMAENLYLKDRVRSLEKRQAKLERQMRQLTEGAVLPAGGILPTPYVVPQQQPERGPSDKYRANIILLNYSRQVAPPSESFRR